MVLGLLAAPKFGVQGDQKDKDGRERDRCGELEAVPYLAET